MSSLVIKVDEVDSTIKEYVFIIFNMFKDDFDVQLKELGLDNWNIAYDIVMKLLERSASYSDDAVKNILAPILKEHYYTKTVDDFSKFFRYVERILNLSEVTPNAFCLEALSEFNDALTIGYFGQLSKGSTNIVEISEDGRQAILKEVSEEMRVYIQKKITEYNSGLPLNQKFLEILHSQKEEIVESQLNDSLMIGTESKNVENLSHFKGLKKTRFNQTEYERELYENMQPKQVLAKRSPTEENSVRSFESFSKKIKSDEAESLTSTQADV